MEYLTVTFSADETFRHALASLQAGRVDESERLFKTLLSAQPRHVGGLNLLSILLTRLGRFEEAEHYVRLALNESATSDATYYNYGIILKALGKPAEALERFNQALAINPGVAETWNNRGRVLNDLKRYQEAVADFDKAICINSNYPDAFCNKGTSLAELKLYDISLAAYDQALTLRPDLAEAWLGRGSLFAKLERHDEAFIAYDRALALKPNLAEAWLGRGTLFTALKQYDSAFAAYGRALTIKPDLADAWLGRGNLFSELKQHDEAFTAYDRALALKPDLAEAWLGRGNVFAELGQHDDAFAAYDRTLKLKPDLAEAWLGRGGLFVKLKQHNDAFAAFDRALTLTPELAKAWLGRGNILFERKKYEDASAAYDRALALKPDLAEAWLGRGNILSDLRQLDAALTAYDRALTLKPDLAEAWLGRGNMYAAYDRAPVLNPDIDRPSLGSGDRSYELGRFDEALAAYARALALKPEFAEAWLGCGDVFRYLKRHEEAAAAYAKVLEINPRHPFVKGMFLHQKMTICDWMGVDDLILDIDGDVISGKLSAEPFGWQGVAGSEQSLQRCAQLYNETLFPANNRTFAGRPSTNKDKIRIAYSSGEFRNQATSYLITGVLEHHDDTRFEIYAVDNGWDDQGELRRRIDSAVHGVVNIRSLSDSSAAAAICQKKIDILINLNGYFGEHRTQVFAQRPAPIQVNYLGFPGTLGATYMDYIIADRNVIPADHRAFYAEKVVYLPSCYQANDDKKEIGARNFNRAEFGLPENAFVFCCFNNNYKIVPDVFDSWMRILRGAPDSVLWLFEGNATAEGNLRKEAVARGVNAERLIFAKPMPLPEHLARHRLADLFLDTLPYNAHTTASDALWTGLPVLTCIGETFAGRVAASLLNAIRLPELITTTSESYEEMAIDLAACPKKLVSIKRRLAENRLTTPLFDTKLFTRHIEMAYAAMYERHRAGLMPDHLCISGS